MKNDTLYAIVAVAVLALALVPLGTSAFVLAFLFGESPCVLCWAQRTGMALVALSAVLILRFGPRPRYIGMGVLIATHGVYMALRHSALHLARDVGQGFAAEMLGAHTYIWSAFIFFVALATMGALLLMTRDGEAAGAVREPGPLGRAAIVAFLVAVAGNAVQALASTGPPPFMGQSDPVRFSFRPSTWVWSLEEWRPLPVSLRGRWDVEKPRLAGLPADPAAGPLAGLPALPLLGERRIGAPLNGRVADLAYDAEGDRFLVTTEAHGVYLLDGGLARVLRHTVLDPHYSVELTELAGAAFLDSRTLLALSTNKSFAVLQENGGADPRRNFRHFLESFDQFEELSRGRFATVRARMNYVMAVAFDAPRDSLWTVTVPSRRHRRLVVSRFERGDMTLAEEFSPRLSAASGLALADPERSLDEYYVSAAAADQGRLYALSAAYSTLLVLDPAAREVVSAHAIAGLREPAGLAVRGGELLVAEAAGAIKVVARP